MRAQCLTNKTQLAFMLFSIHCSLKRQDPDEESLVDIEDIEQWNRKISPVACKRLPRI